MESTNSYFISEIKVEPDDSNAHIEKSAFVIKEEYVGYVDEILAERNKSSLSEFDVLGLDVVKVESALPGRSAAKEGEAGYEDLYDGESSESNPVIISVPGIRKRGRKTENDSESKLEYAKKSYERNNLTNGGKSKCDKRARSKPVKSSNSGNGGIYKRQRSAKFSVQETDLLLNLVTSRSSDDKVSPYGRLAGWKEITEAYNASPNVVQRSQKVLIERVHNVRAGLNKLCAYNRACASAAGAADGHASNGFPPKVSFQMTDAVRNYAVTTNVKLWGSEYQGDSDATSTKASDMDIMDLLTISTVADTDPENVIPVETDTTTSTSLVAAGSPSPFCPTTTQRNSSPEIDDHMQQQYSQIADSIACEESRRTKFHAFQMQCAQEKLQFWKMARKKLASGTMTGWLGSGGGSESDTETRDIQANAAPTSGSQRNEPTRGKEDRERASPAAPTKCIENATPPSDPIDRFGRFVAESLHHIPRQMQEPVVLQIKKILGLAAVEAATGEIPIHGTEL